MNVMCIPWCVSILCWQIFSGLEHKLACSTLCLIKQQASHLIQSIDAEELGKLLRAYDVTALIGLLTQAGVSPEVAVRALGLVQPNVASDLLQKMDSTRAAKWMDMMAPAISANILSLMGPKVSSTTRIKTENAFARLSCLVHCGHTACLGVSSGFLARGPVTRSESNRNYNPSHWFRWANQDECGSL